VAFPRLDRHHDARKAREAGFTTIDPITVYYPPGEVLRNAAQHC
jgi:hypothetical protein